jgi:hypothetical protein
VIFRGKNVRKIDYWWPSRPSDHINNE